jgi:hypothetical protein
MVATTPTLESAPFPLVPENGTRFQPLRARAEADRKRMLDACYEHTRTRDGDLDLATGTLPEREARLRPLFERSVDWEGEVDVDAFYQHLHRVATPDVAVEAGTQWALGVALASESEHYGVQKELENVYKRGLREADRVHLQHVFQEGSHTALLMRACALLGLGNVRFRPPHWSKRAVIDRQVGLPDSIRFPLILLGEMIGTVVLTHLRNSVALFDDDPELAKLLYEILDEVVYDEQLHVYHCACRLGAGGRLLARMLLPAAVATAQREYPVFAALGLDTETFLTRIDQGIQIPPQLAQALP